MFFRKKQSGATHDYTTREWGHNFDILNYGPGGKRLSVAGWGLGIQSGDFLILPNGDGITRYRVDKIEYKRDPPDMWFADLVFDPRGYQKDA